MSSFTDQSAPSSRQNTLSKQIYNEYSDYCQSTHINTQSDQIKHYSLQVGQTSSVDKQPHIDYADQGDGAEFYTAKMGKLPGVNHAVVVSNQAAGQKWSSQVAYCLNI